MSGGQFIRDYSIDHGTLDNYSLLPPQFLYFRNHENIQPFQMD
jgi:hypothetical protein